jgi:hypothetical protein
VVDYDVWSNANRRQQECIIAECQRGSIELTLVVIDAFGKTFNITLDPSIILRPIAKVEEPVDEEAPVEAPVDTQVDEDGEEGPVEEEVIEVDASVIEETVVEVAEEEPVVEEVKLPEAEDEGTAKEVTITEPVITKAEAEQQYDICINNKDWEGAIKVLKAFAGTEELPLSDKTLMAIKDKSFANVIKRYDIGD